MHALEKGNTLLMLEENDGTVIKRKGENNFKLSPYFILPIILLIRNMLTLTHSVFLTINSLILCS